MTGAAASPPPSGATPPLRIAFMGTPDFAVPCLEALVAAGHVIAAVYTQPPRPAGRGRKERRSPVHEAALVHGLSVMTPASMRQPDAIETFRSLALDAAVVVAYGQILPLAILEAPRLGCLNVHASLLPRWRGAAPIQRAILAGDRETGICIMQMAEGLDTGPVLLSEATAITDDDTGGSLHDRLAALGARLIAPALAGRADGSLSPIPQDDAKTCYAAKLTAADEPVDWRRSATEIHRQIRGLSPWPGAKTVLEGTVLKLLAAKLAAGDFSAEPGTTLDDQLTIACGEGALRITRLQRAGKAAMEAGALLNGYPIPAGTRFELP